jgi:hydroxymethylglutaryl-CoA lyase
MKPVKLIECPRDAWQGLKRQIPTERKIAYLNGLISAGFRHIDAVSFVSPKAVPQMADSEEVLQQLKPPPDVEIIAIVVNEKGAERAISTGSVTTIGYPCSVSETFLRRNQNQSAGESMAVLKQIKQRAEGAGLQMNAYISMAFGNPYADAWSEARIAEMAKTLLDLGVDAISLADTVGAAAPELITRLVAAVVTECGGAEVGVHLHSTREGAASKVLAAYDAGCRRFDSAMGGLGGCPFAQDELVGNVPTEEVLQALETRGVKLSIGDRLRDVTSLNRLIGAEFGTA